MRTSKLPPHQREMLILRMGWNCRSEYEWAKHVGSVGHARDQGLDPAKYRGRRRRGRLGSLSTRAILHASDELYRDGVVSDATWRALSEKLDTGLMMSAIFTTATIAQSHCRSIPTASSSTRRAMNVCHRRRLAEDLATPPGRVASARFSLI